jgi:hypothetical protein
MSPAARRAATSPSAIAGDVKMTIALRVRRTAAERTLGDCGATGAIGV